MSYRYRDTQTGHFVTKKTWHRSTSKRYRRESTKRKKFFANMLVEIGYTSSTEGNGYKFTIAIQRKLKETQAHISKRITYLLKTGYFDEWAGEYNERDFQWATFSNWFKVLNVTKGKRKSAAELLDFERE